MSEADFLKRFSGHPIRRAKWSGFLRNVCVALGNSGDPEALPALTRALRHPEPLVRGHAAWALGRLGAAAAARAAGRTEPDPWVREEMELAGSLLDMHDGVSPPSDASIADTPETKIDYEGSSQPGS